MMLFRLAVKNIRKSVKDYAIYFSTLVLGIAIFYVFNAMEASTAFVELSSNQLQIVDLMNQAISGISIFISFILGFLIIYASRFLMKRRKKEFAIYMTLGMGKRSIARILLSETFLIGLFSLVVGLILGIGASQFMSILVAKMFEVDMSAYEFTFSMASLLKTLLYFSIIYVIVMIFSTVNISKGKLIDLLNANRQNENIKVKKTWISILLFLLSIVILSYAYYLVLGKGYDINEKIIGFAILLGCIGTLLFFYSLAGFALKVLQLNKKFYYRKLNMFVARQMNSKINTTVFSMTTICLMLFLTICILSSGISINQSMTREVKKLTPVDLQIDRTINLDSTNSMDPNDSEETKEDGSSEYMKYMNISLSDGLKDIGFDSDKYLQGVLELNVYNTPELTFNTLFSKVIKEMEDEAPMMNMDANLDIMRISDYNKMAKRYHLDTISLTKEQYAIIANYDAMSDLYNAYMEDLTLNLNGKSYQSKYEKSKEGFLDIAANPMNLGIVVLPDEAVRAEWIYKSTLLADYNAADEDGKQKIEDRLETVMKENSELIGNRYGYLGVSTKITIYQASVGLGAIVTFIGIYLGVVFLISSAAILALKELSESNDNKQRYMILRKIGVNEKMINHALFAQIACFFVLPVILAIVHSIFGMKFANLILSTLGKSDLLSSATLAGIFILVIYGGYLLITYFCSKNIIKDTK